MSTHTYLAKTYPFKLLSVLLIALSSLLFPFGAHFSWIKSLVAISGLLLSYLCWKVPSPKIEVDKSGIRRRHWGNSHLLSRIVQPDTEIKWNSIDSVSTRRLNSGTFLTVLSSSEETADKLKHRLTIESSLFRDYVSILRTAKDRATQAHFDEATELILKNQIDIRSVRPFYWGLFVFVVVSAFLYILITEKG